MSVNCAPNDPAEVSASHITLGQDWRLWRTVCLRSAGFPLEPLRQFRLNEALEALAEVDSWAQAREIARLNALKICQQHAKRPGGNRSTWRRLERKLIASASIASDASAALDDALFDELLAKYRQNCDAHAAALKSYRDAYLRDEACLDQSLSELCTSPRFMEALVWQNPELVARNRLLTPRSEPRAPSRQRALNRVLQHYWFRYRTKNESIGFFGPIGWANINEDIAQLLIEPAAQLIEAREVHFEYWAIDALAQALNKTPGLHAWLKPKLVPRVRIDSDGFFNGRGERVNLSWLQREVLLRCDGHLSALKIAEAVAALPLASSNTFAAVGPALSQLAKARTINWRLSTPVSRNSETALRTNLQEIGERDLRNELLAKLDGLVAGLDKLQRLPTENGVRDPARLSADYDALANEFQRLTSLSPKRNAGLTYGGRGLVYEDCRRGVKVEIGSDALQALEQPLSLLLTSARWYTYAVAKQFEATVTHSIVDTMRNSQITHAPLVVYIQMLLDEAPAVIAAVTSELENKWSDLLNLDLGQDQMRFRSADLSARMTELFAAPHAGWPSARFHSPDLMLRRLPAGDEWVLGELHAAANTIAQDLFLAMHPDPDALLQQFTLDKAAAEFSLVPQASFQWGHRVAGGVVDGREDIAVEFGPSPSVADGRNVIAIGSLRLVSLGERLVIEHIDTGNRYPLASLFRTIFRLDALNGFKPIRRAAHVPRISIDSLVIHRESWRIRASSIPFLDIHDPADRFAAMHRWRVSLGLPQQIFCQLPGEKKPIYVDFRSPPTLDIARALFIKERSNNTYISISEMLPVEDEACLHDAEGRYYTSEFRFAALDPIAYPH